MLSRFVAYVRALFVRQPVKLAIVRRYVDANGSYVGELYLDNGNGSYGMIGASLDTLGLYAEHVAFATEPYVLDTANDFLVPMPSNRVRVGALVPEDNDSVRKMIGALPRRRIELMIRNGFIESVVKI